MRALARSVRRLTRAERHAALEALSYAPFASLAIRMFPIERAAALMSPAPRSRLRAPAAPSPERIAAIAYAVLGLAGVRCLSTALVVRRMLARRGMSSDLVVGVARISGDEPRRDSRATEAPRARVASGRLTAHAWLERNGTVLIGAGRQAYAPLWRLDAHAADRDSRRAARGAAARAFAPGGHA
jgi:hypothetical protein